VKSEIGAEGLDLPPPLQRLVGRDAASLAALICRLHADSAEHGAAMSAGLGFVAQGYSEQATVAALHAAILGRHEALAAHG
jgi:hypothetical protein